MTAEPKTVFAALLGRCPRCGQGKLFDGYLHIAPRCATCGLDYAMFDAGDGPAVFVILIVGAIVAGSALVVEVKYSPPYWVHAVLWIPLILILSFAMLRFMKSLLLVLQYKHKAGEGRLG
ncbi:MAG TPA: DUF983 domain-containing protein [Rhizomicrobium sp.]|nr:DUF983 domain-containing protein [Rhizomicrobium sp.]